MKWCLVLSGCVVTGCRGYDGDAPPANCVPWPEFVIPPTGTRYVGGKLVEPSTPQPSQFHTMADSGEWQVDEGVYTRWVRLSRNERLAATDWVVVRAQEAGRPVPPEWVAYRQKLRDIPESCAFPVVWPEPPSTPQG